MNLYINNNIGENENLLKKIKKERNLEKELSSVVCFFEYIPKDNICYIRNIKNTFENNRVKNPTNNNENNPINKTDLSKIIAPQKNNDKEINKNKCYYIKYQNKDFYFIHGISGRTRDRELSKNSTKTADDIIFSLNK